MNEILENEINKLIGRKPTEEELQSAIEYLDGCSDDLTFASMIPGLLEDWRSDCMIKCDNCERYHLPQDMITSEEVEGNFCDETCVYEKMNSYTLAQLESDEYRFNVLK